MLIGKEFYRIKNELKRSILDENKIDNNFEHNSLFISSLSEFIDVICKLTHYYEKFDWSDGTDGVAMTYFHTHRKFVYRGIANSSWKIEPSLVFNELWSKEKIMVDSLRKLYPDDFDGQMSNFEIIAKMQHYGLPTRLCDFTLNPLIALFFACENDQNISKDGRILMAYKDLTNRFDSEINIICNTDFSLYDCGGVLMPLSEYNNQYIKKYMKPDIFWDTFLTLDGLYFSMPACMSERERRQQSVFLIFPNAVHIFDSKLSADYECFCSQKHDENLFKKNNYEDMRISGGHHEVSKEKLLNDFISIIIDNKSKNRILNELSMIGINKATIFPEIEHAAKFIKDDSIKANNLVFQAPPSELSNDFID